MGIALELGLGKRLESEWGWGQGGVRVRVRGIARVRVRARLGLEMGPDSLGKIFSFLGKINRFMNNPAADFRSCLVRSEQVD